MGVETYTETKDTSATSLMDIHFSQVVNSPKAMLSSKSKSRPFKPAPRNASFRPPLDRKRHAKAQTAK
jgi:hypothetical protein